MRSAILFAVLWACPAFGQALDLDGDTDRDGTVSGSQREEDLEGKNSVLVINNCDRDGALMPIRKVKVDNDDDVINGREDRKDLEPIYLCKPDKPLTGRVSLRLKALSLDDVAEKQRFRIFKWDETMILGPSTSNVYIFSDDDQKCLLKNGLIFLVEGLAFATSSKLSVELDGVELDSLILEDAPFLLVPQTQGVRTNYVVKATANCPTESLVYVDKFKKACFSAGAEPAVFTVTADVWIEDEMSWGYSETPRVRMAVALHLYRLGELRDSVRQLAKPGTGYVTLFDYGPDPTDVTSYAPHTLSLNFGGNIEVTPPTRLYPFGRVYYGSVKSSPGPVDDPLASWFDPRQIDARYQAFFERQKVQKPINLCTDWLSVGHVDEIITFLPRDDCKFALVLASPESALKIVSQLPAETPLDPKFESMIPGLIKAKDLLLKTTLAMTLRSYNRMVDQKIYGNHHANADPDSIKGVLKQALGLDESDIFEVPVLFYSSPYTTEPAMGKGAVSLSPDLVNVNVIGMDCLVPEPFFDPFKKEFARVAKRLGQHPCWLDDWDIYHINAGEVHCGSNTRREPFPKKWWDH